MVISSLVRFDDDQKWNMSELEGRISTHDKAIQSIFAAIRALMSPQKFAHKKIGFELRKFRQFILISYPFLI